jgi:predicted DNA-binding transcriptional regulator AlpA
VHVNRKVEPDQLVGAAEIARRLSLSVPQTVHDWRRRHADFPQPIVVLTMGMVWYWPDIEEWARATGRLS